MCKTVKICLPQLCNKLANKFAGQLHGCRKPIISWLQRLRIWLPIANPYYNKALARITTKNRSGQ